VSGGDCNTNNFSIFALNHQRMFADDEANARLSGELKQLEGSVQNGMPVGISTVLGGFFGQDCEGNNALGSGQMIDVCT